MVIPRRWPYITTMVIAMNFILFLAAHDRFRREEDQHAQIESRTLVIIATRPQTPVTPAQQALVDAFKRNHPEDWEQMVSFAQSSAEGLRAQNYFNETDPATVEMADLGRQLERFQNESLIARFAIYPPRLSTISYFTAGFLHRNWPHLLLNMWFLFLVGAIFEDFWGSPVYAAFCFTSGLGTVWAYTLTYPNAYIPLVGATGIICALMGALLVRFPKYRFQRGSALWAVRPTLFRFSSPAYIVFPMWLTAEVIWGKPAGETGNLAYWAQAGAFGFGSVLALVLRFTGIEGRVRQAMEAKESWSADEHVAKAGDYVVRGLIDPAISELKLQIAERPDSVEAYVMLKSLYQRQGDTVSYIRTLETLCRLHLKFSYPEAAWQCYEDYLAAGGRRMPAATWLELSRFVESQQDWERALREYQELVQTWPQEPASVVALMAAGRIQLLQFSRPEEAKRLFTEALKSPVPHAEWDETIRKGLEKATAAIPPAAIPMGRTRPRPAKS